MHSKGNYKQDEKVTLRMEENNGKRTNWQRINLQNKQAAYYQKNKQPSQKICGRSRPTFLQRKKTDGQQTWKDVQHCSLIEKCKTKL